MPYGKDAVLGVLMVSLFTVECGIPFIYSEDNAGDPRKVALLREALMHAGISPDGIILKSFMAKWKLYKTTYKASYINKQGQMCFLKWNVNDLIGTQSPKMPTCENVATGTGSNPPRIQAPAYPLGIGGPPHPVVFPPPRPVVFPPPPVVVPPPPVVIRPPVIQSRVVYRPGVVIRKLPPIVVEGRGTTFVDPRDDDGRQKGRGARWYPSNHVPAGGAANNGKKSGSNNGNNNGLPNIVINIPPGSDVDAVFHHENRDEVERKKKHTFGREYGNNFHHHGYRRT